MVGIVIEQGTWGSIPPPTPFFLTPLQLLKAIHVQTEINGLESIAWLNHKISASGFVSDAKVFGELIMNIAPNYKWNPGDLAPSGGTLNFKGEFFTFNRTVSTNLEPAVWTQK